MSRRVSLAISVVLSMVLVLAIPLSAYADSFVEKPKEEYIFKVFPKKTTKYKSMGTKSTSVKKLYTEHKKIYAVSNGVNVAVGAMSMFLPPQVKPVGKVVVAGSAVTYLISGHCMKSLSKYLKKNGVTLKTKIEWKWVKTNAMPYEMKFKTTSWYDYKGKAISKKTSSTRTMCFSYGERWWKR